MPLDRNSIAASHTLPANSSSSFPAMFAFAARTSPTDCTRRRHVSTRPVCDGMAIGCDRQRVAYAATGQRKSLIVRRDRSLRSLRRRGLAAVRHSGVVDTRRDAGRRAVGDVRALSPKGAMGLMQIMPQTWAGLRLRYGLGADPYDPHDNILAGAAYLRELHDRYGAPGFLAAYNAGPARYEDHLATGRPLPAETRAYLAVLAPLIGGGSIDGAMVVAAVARSWTEAPLFACT